MADHQIPHFQNDHGYKTIDIGVKEFMCVGASSPFDHPHIFLDMGADDTKICPYCSTFYQYNSKLQGSETIPQGCHFDVNHKAA